MQTKRNRSGLRNVAALAVVVALAGWTSGAQATTITALGVDPNRGEYWRSGGPGSKPVVFDPNRDGAYGSDGYHVYGNNTVLSSPPSYVASVTQLGVWTSYDYSVVLDDPTQPIGATVANLSPVGMRYSYTDQLNLFSFRLSRPKEFVLAVIVDAWSETRFTPPEIDVAGPGGALAAQTGLLAYANNVPDYVFFLISGAADDTFTVSMATNPGGYMGTAGIAFEQVIPEPSVALLLGLGGLLVWRRRRH